MGMREVVDQIQRRAFCQLPCVPGPDLEVVLSRAGALGAEYAATRNGPGWRVLILGAVIGWPGVLRFGVHVAGQVLDVMLRDPAVRLSPRLARAIDQVKQDRRQVGPETRQEAATRGDGRRWLYERPTSRSASPRGQAGGRTGR
jgi:hypothetical protein